MFYCKTLSTLFFESKMLEFSAFGYQIIKLPETSDYKHLGTTRQMTSFTCPSPADISRSVFNTKPPPKP